jgi:hypothetical protein
MSRNTSDSKRWAIYQTEAIENCYSVWKFQDFSEKKNIFKIQKQLPFGQRNNGKLSAVIFVVFKYFPFS